MNSRPYIIDPQTYSWTSLLKENWKVIKQEYDYFCKYVKDNNGIKKIATTIRLDDTGSITFPAEVIEGSVKCSQAGKPLEFQFTNFTKVDSYDTPVVIDRVVSKVTVPEKATQTVDIEYSYNVLLGFQERIYDGIWIPLAIHRYGATNPMFEDFFKQTLSIVKQIPGLESAMYSLIEPGTHIKPHRGYSSDVLRLHLGLTPKQDAVLKVGDQELTWDEGSIFIFDDSELHEVWHRGDKTRISFILDFKRDPEGLVKYPEFIEARMRRNKLIDLQNSKR
jgi:ornithine lipid ester-linked acyl 2-hydroxylase